MIEGRITSKMEAAKRTQAIIDQISGGVRPAVKNEVSAQNEMPLPTRCNRMIKQFDCLDTALAFAKARSTAPAVFVALQATSPHPRDARWVLQQLHLHPKPRTKPLALPQDWNFVQHSHSHFFSFG